MKTTLLLLLTTVVLLTACNPSSEAQNTEMPMATSTSEVKAATKLLRHVVLFKFKESATEEEVAAIETAFAALPQKIEAIHDFEWGTNNSPEGLDKGLTHCFFVSFLSEEDRAIYLPHPDHMAFVELVTPHVEDVTVVDYWVE